MNNNTLRISYYKNNSVTQNVNLNVYRKSNANIPGSFCPFIVIEVVWGREMCDRCVIMYTHWSSILIHTHRCRLIKMAPHSSLLSQWVFSEALLLYTHTVYACAIMGKFTNDYRHGNKVGSPLYVLPSRGENLKESTCVYLGRGMGGNLKVCDCICDPACVSEWCMCVCEGASRWRGSVQAYCCGACWCVLAKYSAVVTELLRAQSLILSSLSL